MLYMDVDCITYYIQRPVISFMDSTADSSYIHCFIASFNSPDDAKVVQQGIPTAHTSTQRTAAYLEFTATVGIPQSIFGLTDQTRGDTSQVQAISHTTLPVLSSQIETVKQSRIIFTLLSIPCKLSWLYNCMIPSWNVCFIHGTPFANMI